MFFADKCGLPSTELPLTLDSLDVVEGWCRTLAKGGFKASPFDRDTFETLVTNFLGEVLIE